MTLIPKEREKARVSKDWGSFFFVKAGGCILCGALLRNKNELRAGLTDVHQALLLTKPLKFERTADESKLQGGVPQARDEMGIRTRIRADAFQAKSVSRKSNEAYEVLKDGDKRGSL